MKKNDAGEKGTYQREDEKTEMGVQLVCRWGWGCKSGNVLGRLHLNPILKDCRTPTLAKIIINFQMCISSQNFALNSRLSYLAADCSSPLSSPLSHNSHATCPKLNSLPLPQKLLFPQPSQSHVMTISSFQLFRPKPLESSWTHSWQCKVLCLKRSSWLV